MLLVERDPQLSLLEHLLTDAGYGRGRVAVVRGGVASGKTSLMFRFAERATASGALFLHATGVRAERELPFGVMSQLFQAAALPAGDATRITDLFDRARSSGWPLDPAHDPIDEVAAAVMTDLGTALLDLTTHRTVLVGVDDAEYADAASLRCLLLLVRRIRPARMMLVVSECALPQRPPMLFAAELLRQPHCRQVSLPPLSRTGVAELLASLLPAPAARQLAGSCNAVSSGNPLLVRAIAEDQHATQSNPSHHDGIRLEIADTYRQAVLSCLYRGEPDLLQVARAAAVLGSSATPARIGRLAGLAAQLVIRSLDALKAAGLFGDDGFRHPAGRTAILEDITPTDRADLHRRAGALLHDEGEMVTVVADHLVAAGEAGFPWGISTLCQAAEQVLVSGEATTAVQYLRLALAADTDHVHRIEIVTMLARAEWRIDPTMGSRHLEELCAALRDGLLRGRHSFTPIRQLLWHGGVARAQEIIRHMEQVADLDSETRATLAASQQWVNLSYPPFGLRTGVKGRPGQHGGGECLHLVNPLTTVLERRSDSASVDAALQILQCSRLDDDTLGPMIAALVALMYASRLEEAAASCDALIGDATARGAPTWQALLTGIRSEITMRQGDMAATERHARRALAYLPLPSWGTAIGRPLSSLIIAVTAMDNHDEAAHLLSLPVPSAMFDTKFGLGYLCARGYYYLAIGRPAAGLGNFLACGELMAKWGLDQPVVAPWRSGAAQASLHLHDRARAKALVEEQLARLHPGELRTRGISLRLLAAATSEPRKRSRLLREAVNALRQSGDRLELAAALTDLGLAHRALGELDRARVTVSQAHHVALECRAEILLKRIAPSLHWARPSTKAGETSTAQNGLSALSEAERRVASLAAQGYTNREIAQQLYVTPSTVEQHLTRVYRKLNVSRRWDLPEELSLDLSARS